MKLDDHRENLLGPDIAIGHEVKDVSVNPIVITGAGLALVLIAVGLIVYGMFRYLSAHPFQAGTANPMEETSSQQIPPEPRVEEHPQIELQELRARENQILSTYGWVDRQKGIVRIPIDRAMELQLQRGFPVRKPPTAAVNPTGKGTPQ